MKVSKPLVSVIIPVFNVDKYLEKCLISVVNQSYTRLQILLIDDGSTDDSYSICKKWSKKDSRITTYRKRNGGLSDARNYGLQYAKGELVSFIDSDDWISLEMISDMVNVFLNNNVDMVTCQFVEMYPDYAHLSYKSNEYLTIIDRDEMLKELLDDNKMTNQVWRKMYKRCLMPEKPFTVGKNFEDILAMPDLVAKCKYIGCLNKGLYFYRKRRNGSIVSSGNLKNIGDRYFAIKHATTETVSLCPKLKDYAYKSLIKKDLDVYRELISTRNILRTDAKPIIKNIRADLNKRQGYFKVGYREIIYAISIMINVPLSVVTYKLFHSDSSFLRKVVHKIRGFICKRRKMRSLNHNLRKERGKKFFVLAVPDYGNLGDQALKFAEYKFIKEHFPDFKIVPIPLSEMYLTKVVKRNVDKGDYVSLQAGGNIGTLYPRMHLIQEKAISLFKDSKTFIFPQTLYFEKTENGEKMLLQTKKVYSEMNSFLLFLREKISYKFAVNEFKEVNSFLMPDMALSLNANINTNFKRVGAMILLRNDLESTISLNDVESLLAYINKKFDNQITQEDTHIYYDGISDGIAYSELKKLLEKMARSELVITDRLHGMVFAALTNTPCIVLHSKSPKIEGVYSWIKNNKYISLIENVSELPEAIERVMNVNNPCFDKSSFDNYYALMEEKIREL